MKHGSLFSGIGGFDLAAESMGWENVFHCEWMPFPRKILSHYWPEAASYHDITSTDFSIHRGQIDFFPEDSLVSRIARRAKEKGKTTIVTSGPICYDAYEKSDLVGSWAKTFSALLLGMPGWYSRKCALIWNLKVTPYSRLFFQLRPSTHRTEETAYGLLPTMTASFTGILNKGNHDTTRAYRELHQKGLLTTPRAVTIEESAETRVARKAKRESHGLAMPTPNIAILAHLRMLPTPKAQEARGNASIDRGKYNLTDEVAARYKPTSRTSQLSPRFVAEMMGFPTNWTELPFQSGELNQSKGTETQ